MELTTLNPLSAINRNSSRPSSLRCTSTTHRDETHLDPQRRDTLNSNDVETTAGDRTRTGHLSVSSVSSVSSSRGGAGATTSQSGSISRILSKEQSFRVNNGLFPGETLAAAISGHSFGATRTQPADSVGINMDDGDEVLFNREDIYRITSQLMKVPDPDEESAIDAVVSTLKEELEQVKQMNQDLTEDLSNIKDDMQSMKQQLATLISLMERR